MLKLKLQYFGYLMRRTDSFGKTLMLEKIEGGRRRGWPRMRWMASATQWTRVWVNSGSWWWTGRPDVLQSMGRKESDTTERLDWTESLFIYCYTEQFMFPCQYNCFYLECISVFQNFLWGLWISCWYLSKCSIKAIKCPSNNFSKYSNNLEILKFFHIAV